MGVVRLVGLLSAANEICSRILKDSWIIPRPLMSCGQRNCSRDQTPGWRMSMVSASQGCEVCPACTQCGTEIWLHCTGNSCASKALGPDWLLTNGKGFCFEMARITEWFGLKGTFKAHLISRGTHWMWDQGSGSSRRLLDLHVGICSS